MFVDFSSRPPSLQFDGPASHLTNYRRVYQGTERQVADADCADPLAGYLATYERLNARHVVLKARDLTSTFGVKIANEDVAAFCRTNGERYIGFAGVDPHKGEAAVAEFEYAVRDLGLRGLNVQGFEHRLPIDDPLLFPLYRKCVELGMPVNIHCGTNFSTQTSMMYGHPAALDRVMMALPELRVCASPPGWPWVQELLAVAWRHPNLWIGTVAVRPRLLATAHSGYEPLLQYGRTVLKKRMIFGSAFPMMPVEQALSEFDALPLTDAVREDWRCNNALEFLGL
ncbi:amidohydrolase family protein [Paraburkholderia xenovorans]|uniref:amidohydrolase family protein n=1 Tax=Paraburkholderia xenovorans TaxID=36873 RepID=UPI001559AA74|nr:amidohydrolase family protein [Paraburkholderia xenovorans]NPT36443.1 amidohydrolase family protein [Paraburkholderia xenovorans]